MTLVQEQTRKPPKRLPKPVGLTIVLALLAVVVFGVGYGGERLYTAAFGVADYSGPGTGSVVVQVRAGDTASDVATTLYGKGVIKSEQAFTDAAKSDQRSRDLQPGFYALHLRMAAAKALALLLDPTSRVRGRVTLPEGISLADVVDRLVKYTELKRADVLAALQTPAVLGLPGYAQNRPEGFLFPATYDVEPGTGAVQALTQMTEKFSEEAAGLGLEDGARAVGLTPYQVVIVASLVEAETPLDADRPKVARVVLNRLKLGMALQLDSTVNYFRTVKKARLSLGDIGVESPYNTYLNKGLPPTPINSPGTKALDAALHPAAGDWLYFITIDKQGHSLFTSSYDAFLKAKAKAQRDGVY